MARVPTHLAVGVVEGDDVRAGAGQLERVAAEAGAGVEHEVARPQPEAVEADRQHQRRAVRRPLRRQLGDVGRHRQHLAVLLDGELGAVPPAPPLDHTASRPAAPMRSRSSASSSPRRSAASSDSASPAWACSTVSPSRPGDLGQRAAVGGHEARAGAHRLDRRQAEALVQAGHDGQLGLGVELDDALVGDAADEVDVRAQAELVDQVVAGARRAACR